MVLNFVGKPEVLARLTYDANGKPMALAAGKVRERKQDLELIMTWLRATVKETLHDD